MKRVCWALVVSVGLACGDEAAPPEPPVPPAGTYHVAELHYQSLCYAPDTVTIDAPPFVENTLAFRLTPADSVRGIFDALPDGRLTVVFRAPDYQEDLRIATGPEYGHYVIQRDTLWLAMPQTRWLSAVPFTEWRAGTLAGAIAQGCESLAVRLAR